VNELLVPDWYAYFGLWSLIPISIVPIIIGLVLLTNKYFMNRKEIENYQVLSGYRRFLVIMMFVCLFNLTLLYYIESELIFWQTIVHILCIIMLLFEYAHKEVPPIPYSKRTMRYSY